jgi:hypothetical protein
VAGYECSLCQGEEQATILITPLTGGETMAIGEDCMSVAFTGMLAGHLAIDAEKLWGACERLIKAQAKQAAKGIPGTEDASADGKGLALVPDTGTEGGAEAGGE